ncbi:MAG: hypothetical protein M1830_009608 [Pleopsidium flavum]|nr:MAG: hypothetical protein M1830_009608 [Pleopsidium flavum]
MSDTNVAEQSPTQEEEQEQQQHDNREQQRSSGDPNTEDQAQPGKRNSSGDNPTAGQITSFGKLTLAHRPHHGFSSWRLDIDRSALAPWAAFVQRNSSLFPPAYSQASIPWVEGFVRDMNQVLEGSFRKYRHVDVLLCHWAWPKDSESTGNLVFMNTVEQEMSELCRAFNKMFEWATDWFAIPLDTESLQHEDQQQISEGIPKNGDEDEPACSRKLKEKIKGIFEQLFNPDDPVIIYYAGHGGSSAPGEAPHCNLFSCGAGAFAYCKRSTPNLELLAACGDHQMTGGVYEDFSTVLNKKLIELHKLSNSFSVVELSSDMARDEGLRASSVHHMLGRDSMVLFMPTRTPVDEDTRPIRKELDDKVKA